MAYEFLAPIISKNVPFVALAEKLQSSGVCAIESATSGEATFRWLETQRREHWPEDATISFCEDGLLLTIHSGTQQKRRLFVELVTAIASELLCEDVTFEEM